MVMFEYLYCPPCLESQVVVDSLPCVCMVAVHLQMMLEDKALKYFEKKSR